MSDFEQPETDSTEQAAPAPTEAATADTATDDPGLQGESAEEESDYEVGDKKYRVGAALKAHLDELRAGSLRQEDYTTKTQSVAEARRELEAQQQQFVARQEFQQKHIQAVAKVISIDERLEQFSKLDWNAITDADPVQALKLDRQMRDLQQQRQQTVGDIEREQGRQQLEASQATARQLQDARALLAREIKGYGTPEVTKALTEVGKAAGYKAEELAQVNDPRAIKLLHKAYLYDQLVAKAKAPEPKSEAAPITRVTGASATATRDPSRMTDHEFATWRKRQIAQR